MAPSNRPDGHLNLNYLPQLSAVPPKSGSSTSNTSPIEPPTGSSGKNPFGGHNSLSNGGTMGGSSRLGAGSPSHELGGRLYSKRAREIQAQEGLAPGSHHIWGPPTSGNSTPLRENIPESPSQDGFPDLVPQSQPEINPSNSARRARAGTVPSRFSPVGTINGINLQQPTLFAKTSRPTPSTSPFRPPGLPVLDSNNLSASNSNNASLQSRLRAGSMPQRASLLGSSTPFGTSLFSTNWSTGRERGTTLTSIRSSEGPSSPAQSTFSRDGLADTDVRTLDYLGLAETPQQSLATLARPNVDLLLQQQQQAAALAPFLNDLSVLNKANRFRSWSVNAKEKLAEEEDDQYIDPYSGVQSGTLTPSAASAAAALAATQAQIHQHNLAVQAFANHASASRPRARTAGVLDTPPQRSMRSYLTTPSRLDNSFTAADLRLAESGEYDGLVEAVQSMQIGGLLVPGNEYSDDNNLEGPTRALWIGSIPVSTTVTSLDAIFKLYGKIESTRVLTHKNCGFVNYEHIESAIQAKSLLNGKEIFPGAGPVRIGYAKVPSLSNNGTPGPNGVQPSPTPDINDVSKSGANGRTAGGGSGDSAQKNGINAETAAAALELPDLSELRHEMVQIASEFGATGDETIMIANSIERAVSFNNFEKEIPPVPEPSHARIHDAPKLRDIRKRIDNNVCSQAEIEEIAMGMLPEIAELSSDYLGNTVVQKLFEYCSEDIKDCMLKEIAPYLAEIGVHKNGTWAAQKIIDVAKTPSQMNIIMEYLRPYTVALFLDQYGNYVLQCCLRFGAPYNDFIFETMLNKMWDIAQGRFGARAMRACLESHHAAKYQQRMLASAIALHSVQLATNTNGALLLTWFLDTCTFPHRRSVLAPRLEPHFVHLCTHKLAYLTVLKVINQRNEPEAREQVLQALFFSNGEATLENILSDQNCGSTFVFKVLTTPYFDEALRAEVVENVRNVLIRIKASPNQGYKRLMDEVGMSVRNGGSSRDNHHNRDTMNNHGPRADNQRPMPQPSSGINNYSPQANMERQYSGQYVPGIHTQQYDHPGSISRSSSTDPTNYSPYDQFSAAGLPGAFTQSPISPMNPQQQLQYQAYLNAMGRGAPGGPFYPGMGTSGLTANGFGAYATPSPSVDGYRNIPAHNSPLASALSHMSPNPMLPQTQFQPPQFNPAMGGQLFYSPQTPQTPQGFYSQQQAMQAQQQQVGGRRGRR